MQQRGWLQDDGGTPNACRVHEKGAREALPVSDLDLTQIETSSGPLHLSLAKTSSGTSQPVITENSVQSENTGVPIIREIMVATTMSSLFVTLFAMLASSFRTRAALQAEILPLRHQLAVMPRRRLSLQTNYSTSEQPPSDRTPDQAHSESPGL